MSNATATAGLERLQAALEKAESRFAELEQQRSAVARRVDRARSPWVEYVREVELGERVADPAEEARLKAAWQEVAASLSREDVIRGDRGVIETEWIDPAFEARLSAAFELRTRREDELRAYIAEHGAKLAAERMSQSEAAGARVNAAIHELLAAMGDWRGEARFWIHVLDFEPEDVPQAPIAYEVDPQGLGSEPVPGARCGRQKGHPSGGRCWSRPPLPPP